MITIDITLKQLSDSQKLIVEKELYRKNLKYSVEYDRIKREAKYHLQLTASGQKYLLPTVMKKALGA